jgi:uncharacterized protein YbcI
MAQAMKEYYGKGPETAKSYMVDDLLFVVLREGITTSEKTMLNAGEQDIVRVYRQRFQNEMAPVLCRKIEELTERKVIGYQSQILFDPDMVIEMFVFDRPVGAGAEATAQGQLNNTEVGLQIGEDPPSPEPPPLDKNRGEVRANEPTDSGSSSGQGSRAVP